MKKLIFILIAAVSLAAPRALAQEVFSHAALGISAGLDGVGIEAATVLGDNFQLRAGYSLMPFTYSKNKNLGSGTVNGEKRDFNNTPVTVKMWKGGNASLLADWFPGEGSFHVTAGVYAGSGKLLAGELDVTKPIKRDEWGRVAAVFDSGASFSTDANGIAHVDAVVWKVMPYVGIGLGRAIGDGPVSFTFDLGALVTGGAKPQIYNYIRNTMDPSNPVEATKLTSAMVNNKDKGWIDKIGNIPVFPMLKVNLFFNLF